MLILFYLLTFIFVVFVNSKIVIKDAGVAAISRGDIGMIFYITMVNKDDCSYHIFTKMIKCCEIILDSADRDCEAIQLIGGDMGIVQKHGVKNITLLFPNLYLHDRVGSCLVGVQCSNSAGANGEISWEIKFNTTISKTNVPEILKGYYDAKHIKLCSTVDLDPLDDCRPVDCQIKYLGTRNFFSRKWSRCQKVPYCVSDPNKDLPDVAIVPINNRCRDLEIAINKSDLIFLEEEIGTEKEKENSVNFNDLASNIRCHHGRLNNETGFCVCDPGWNSAPFDKDQYGPSLAIYHMCNVEMGTWNSCNETRIKVTILIIAIFGVCITMAILLFAFLLQCIYRCIKAFEKKDFNNENPSNENGNVKRQTDNSLANANSFDSNASINSQNRTSRISTNISESSFVEEPLRTYKRRKKDVVISNISDKSIGGDRTASVNYMTSGKTSEAFSLALHEISSPCTSSVSRSHSGSDVSSTYSEEFVETEQFQPKRSCIYR